MPGGTAGRRSRRSAGWRWRCSSPALRWSGPGYLDTQLGRAPAGGGFRALGLVPGADPRRRGRSCTTRTRREGGEQSLALRVAADGGVTDFAPPPRVALPPTLWRVPRDTRADGPVRVVRTLEDAPFYSRSVIETQLLGERVTAVHESLSMDRFTAPWVQAMLPFRIPRRW